MWSNARPSSRSSVGDHFNNNSNPNPYSRNSTISKNKPGRTSADPWDWGWDGEENSSSQQQDEWNSTGWGQTSGQNIIQTSALSSHPTKPSPNMFSQVPKPDRSAHRTPDLIPDKPNNNRGIVYPVGNQRFNSSTSQPHPSDFFENIDLVSNNHKTSPSPKLYNPSEVGRPQPGADPVFSYFQPQNVPVQNNPQNIPYFRQTSSPHVPHTEQMPFYKQHPQHPPLPPQQYNAPPSLSRQQQQPPPPLTQQQYPGSTLPPQHHTSSYLQQSSLQHQQHPSPPLPYQQLNSSSPGPQQYPSPPPSSQQQQQQQPPPSVSSYYQNYKHFETESTYQQSSYYDQQHSFIVNPAATFSTTHSASEVENVEVPSVSQSPKINQTPTQIEDQIPTESQSVVPDNQETVGDEDEHIVGNTLSAHMSQLRLDSNDSADSWNNTPGWENQEVAPRCELDRNQYLETGQLLESGEPEENVGRPDVENNDEGEPLPPPGLHRMVTGQVTDSPTQRSVLGQGSTESANDLNGLQRLVPGQQAHSDSPVPVEMSGLQRLVPGQIHGEDSPSLDSNTFQRMVPGHNSQLQRLIPGQQQTDSDELGFQRLIPGQNEGRPPLDTRMIPGQISDEDTARTQDNTLERMVPGGLSEQNSLTEDGLDDERMVPGGLSDMESRSQSVLNDDLRLSSERMIPGRTQLDSNSRLIIQSESSSTQPERRISAETERQVTIGSIEPQEPPISQSSGESGRHLINQRVDSGGQSRQGMHRRVVGYPDSHGSDLNRAQTPDREDSSLPGNQPIPPRLQRMVLGQFREKSIDSERDQVNVDREKDRDEDSDSDYHAERRKSRRHKENYEEEGRSRDYSSERDYRGRREDREKYRKKQEHNYNRSPDYRSDQDEYDRHDYRDRRDRDRRDRPRDRDRRRRSPDYSYDSYYRDDVRKHPRERGDRRGDRERYYDHYEEDYYRENRSRPSSRSGSDYRRPLPRDYSSRNPYYPEPVNNYQMLYHQMQQYYENMRRNDPQAYALWYERYMAEKYAAGNNSYGNDRASVHSGRSSVNIHERGLEEEGDGIKAEEEVSLRSTPAFYQSAHVRGELNSLGQLVMIHPQDAYEYGEQKALVDICKLPSSATPADNDDVKDFLLSPGPFIVGVTHKNTVLQYLKRQVDTCRHSSEKLLYELICLVIKLNGVVDMTDVANLLMESYNKSIGESDPYLQQMPADVPDTSQLSQHQITCKFRELLLEGNKTEALDWAMKNGSWGHALFLASKMDSRTHNNVMLRFANGLQINDPLQTLYQFMSGREPQAATCAADKRWGDWRPHLAMMLSNRTIDPELDRKAILSLGHSLGSRGRIFACHFCYLTAQLDFSSYADRNSNKLVLLGSSPDLPFSHFSSCRSIMLTMCYEYAKQLSSRDYSIPSLRLYKFLLAVRLIDHHQFTPALAYLELIAEDIMRAPSRHDRPLAMQVLQLADKIKFSDSTLSIESDPSVDPDWLARLRNLEETSESNYVSSNLSHGISTSTVSDTEFYTNGDNASQIPVVSNEVTQQNYYENQQQMWLNSQQSAQPSQEMPQVPGLVMEQNMAQPSQDNPSIDYWANNNMAWQSSTVPAAVEQEQNPQPDFGTQLESTEPEPAPQISVKSGFGYYASTEENSNTQVKPQSPVKSAPKPKPAHRNSKDKVQQSGAGWFGGIWDKLAFRPKNQMKLPDDKNPSIVWDEKGKRWINTETNGEDEASQLKPPPRADELPSFGPTPKAVPTVAPVQPAMPVTSAPTSLPPTGPNKYKLQRGKGMRANYIDVMNPGNKKPAASVPVSDVFGAIPPQTSVPQNLFIPAPITGNETAPVDFISQSGPVSFDKSVTRPDEQMSTGGYDNTASPTFYNPSSFSS